MKRYLFVFAILMIFSCTPDPVVIENMRAAYNGLTPELKLGLVQVTLRKYGEPVQVTPIWNRILGQIDEHLQLTPEIKKKYLCDNARRAFKLEG